MAICPFDYGMAFFFAKLIFCPEGIVLEENVGSVQNEKQKGLPSKKPECAQCISLDLNNSAEEVEIKERMKCVKCRPDRTKCRSASQQNICSKFEDFPGSPSSPASGPPASLSVYIPRHVRRPRATRLTLFKTSVNMERTSIHRQQRKALVLFYVRFIHRTSPAGGFSCESGVRNLAVLKADDLRDVG